MNSTRASKRLGFRASEWKIRIWLEISETWGLQKQLAHLAFLFFLFEVSLLSSIFSEWCYCWTCSRLLFKLLFKSEVHKANSFERSNFHSPSNKSWCTIQPPQTWFWISFVTEKWAKLLLRSRMCWVPRPHDPPTSDRPEGLTKAEITEPCRNQHFQVHCPFWAV